MFIVLQRDDEFYAGQVEDKFQITRPYTTKDLQAATVFKVTLEEGKLVTDKPIPEGEWSLRSVQFHLKP